MKIIISPAKKMNIDRDSLAPRGLPVFIHKAEVLLKYLKTLTFEELKSLLDCNEKIARLNYDRYQEMDLRKLTSPAILSYDGIQYNYMAPDVFEDKYFEYAEKHLRILSGFYGILKPFDAVVPYRLEMQAKLKTDFCNNLYEFWKDLIYKEITNNENLIVNLASDEYSKIIAKYLEDNITYITCTFGELINNKIKEKGVYVKMARGEAVRFMAENNIQNPEDLKHFSGLKFKFRQEYSTDKNYVFIREDN